MTLIDFDKEEMLTAIEEKVASAETDKNELAVSIMSALDWRVRKEFTITDVAVKSWGDELEVSLEVKQVVDDEVANEEVEAVLNLMDARELRAASANGMSIADDVNSELHSDFEEVTSEVERVNAVAEALAKVTGVDASWLPEVVSIYVDQDFLDQVDGWDVRVVAEGYLDFHDEDDEEDDEEW